MSSKRLFYNLHVTSGNLTPDALNLTGITSSCAQITNLNAINTTISSLYISSTADASNTSLASVVLSGGMTINKTLLINGNINISGVTTQFGGSFTAANNVISASNISGFILNNTVFGSFTSTINVNLVTSTQNLNAQYTIEGTKTNSGWTIIVSILGDDTGINFTMNNSGQLQYISSNQISWISTIINYQVSAINLSSGNISIVPTSGNSVVSGSLSVLSTMDANSSSSASLSISGGLSVLKSIYVGGNIGINTTSPIYALDVTGDIRANNGLLRSSGDTGLYNDTYSCSFYRNDAHYGNWRIGSGNAMNSWNGLRFTQPEISIVAGNGSIKQCGFYYNSIGWGLFLDENRNLFIPGNITAYWSDRRLKSNLQQLSDVDYVLNSLTGYTFNWNEKGQQILKQSGNELEIGLIAQDVQKVIPQAVTINKAGQSLEKDSEPFDYLTINYDKIIPYLIEGYKAQKAEIEELKSKIIRLEKN